MIDLRNYILNPHSTGIHEQKELRALTEQYPYFHAAHILYAKSLKNAGSYGFHKGLKMASLYAGDRKQLYRFIEDKGIPAATEPDVLHRQVESENTPLSPIAPQLQGSVTPPVVVSDPAMEPSEKEIEKAMAGAQEDIDVPVIHANHSESETHKSGDSEASASEHPEMEIPQETPDTSIPVREQNTGAEPEEHQTDVVLPESEELKEPAFTAEISNPPHLASEIQEEHDFLAWLDALDHPAEAPLTESGPFEDTDAKEDSETRHLLTLQDATEDEEETAVYDPAGWAEIAYDIQAFVKPRTEPETPSDSKKEIDELLDRFIKKNPTISRVKTAFYKPENMARKSEEFHGEVASETLAALFYKQGHLHKALELYEKLILQNPDKKEIFAARITTIKEELINRL